MRAIFKWICSNVRFDTEAFWQEKQSYTKPQDVIKYRTATAKGYANLFTALCEKSGLQVSFVNCFFLQLTLIKSNTKKAHTIDGIGKGGDFGTMALTTPDTEHTWNSVCVKGEWVCKTKI